jgi:hypothetical protein
VEAEIMMKRSKEIQGTPAMIHANFTGTIALSPFCHQIVVKVWNVMIFKSAKSARQSHEGKP